MWKRYFLLDFFDKEDLRYLNAIIFLLFVFFLNSKYHFLLNTSQLKQLTTTILKIFQEVFLAL